MPVGKSKLQYTENQVYMLAKNTSVEYEKKYIAILNGKLSVLRCIIALS